MADFDHVSVCEAIAQQVTDSYLAGAPTDRQLNVMLEEIAKKRNDFDRRRKHITITQGVITGLMLLKLQGFDFGIKTPNYEIDLAKIAAHTVDIMILIVVLL